MLALVETLRARVRKKLDTYVLFLDLQKAYDSVHRDAMSHLLKTMGVPAHFVDFIVRWFNQRRSSVLVNGQLADPFPVAKGLPQGEILAPDLFNLFITPLQYYLDELQGYGGVEWPAREAAGARRLVIRDLWYADDMAALAVSASELQLVLNAVARWSADWGINIGFGDGKTAVMYVPWDPKARQDASRTPDVFAGGVKVAWVDEYRYLGMRLRSDLQDAGTLDMLQRRLTFTGNRYIVYNKAVRSMSVATQRQLVHTMVLGCVSYLAAVLPLTNTHISQKLDPPINRVVRSVFGARMLTPVTNLLADSGMMPMVAQVAQHRARLHQTLRLLEGGQTPAALVARELERDLHTPGSVKGSSETRSWAATVHDTYKHAKMVTGMQADPTASDIAHVHTVSARFGRVYAYHLLRSHGAAVAWRTARSGRPCSMTPPLHCRRPSTATGRLTTLASSALRATRRSSARGSPRRPRQCGALGSRAAHWACRGGSRAATARSSPAPAWAWTRWCRGRSLPVSASCERLLMLTRRTTSTTTPLWHLMLALSVHQALALPVLPARHRLQHDSRRRMRATLHVSRARCARHRRHRRPHATCGTCCSSARTRTSSSTRAPCAAARSACWRSCASSSWRQPDVPSRVTTMTTTAVAVVEGVEDASAALAHRQHHLRACPHCRHNLPPPLRLAQLPLLARRLLPPRWLASSPPSQQQPLPRWWPTPRLVVVMLQPMAAMPLRVRPTPLVLPLLLQTLTLARPPVPLMPVLPAGPLAEVVKGQQQQQQRRLLQVQTSQMSRRSRSCATAGTPSCRGSRRASTGTRRTAATCCTASYSPSRSRQRTCGTLSPQAPRVGDLARPPRSPARWVTSRSRTGLAACWTT